VNKPGLRLEKQNRIKDRTICQEVADDLKASEERYVDSDDEDFGFKA
jgi:hypothetical protein